MKVKGEVNRVGGGFFYFDFDFEFFVFVYFGLYFLFDGNYFGLFFMLVVIGLK